MAVEAMSERRAIIDWFETDFKETAKRTTKTSRLEDGRVSYRFSVVNNSGYDFSRFSFRVKILNKADGREIGSAVINAGEWANGETKNFKSKIAIPRDVRSISFVMFSESVDYEAQPADRVSSTIRDIGDVLTGADSSGGVFGELFGTGGMPETTVTKTTTTRSPSGTTTTRTTTTTSRGGTVRTEETTTRKAQTQSPNRGQTQARRQTQSQSSPMQTYVQRKNEKKLNKMRLGKSGWNIAGLSVGAIFLMAAAGSTGDPESIIAYSCIGVAALIATAVNKLVMSRRAKRIRMYESKINFRGNTSLDELAAYVGRPVDKVADDLQKMIVNGFFPEAYIDINNRLLVMTKNGEPIESVEKSAAALKKAKRKAAREKGLVPESIDDLITMTDDGQIKAKLKELRTITKKIDQRVEERPELESQVKEFREKYYPEVVRLTDDYNEKIANLGKYNEERTEEKAEDKMPEINANPNYLQEQATEIKDQLIKLIDSVTEASENLLEKLHEDDIMDITTDIKMLQTTLASKGLLDSDFDLR